MTFPENESSISTVTLLRAREGDDDAWATIWIRYSDRVFHQAMRFGIAPCEAEDITVEVFRKAWSNLSDFSRSSEGQSLGAWMNRITKTTTLDFLRSRKRACPTFGSGSSIFSLENPISQKASPVWLALWQAMGIVENEMSERNWECFRLARFAGLPHGEIGEQLGMSPSNVSTTVQRVFKKIREQALGLLQAKGFTLDDEGRLVRSLDSEESYDNFEE